MSTLFFFFIEAKGLGVGYHRSATLDIVGIAEIETIMEAIRYINL